MTEEKNLDEIVLYHGSLAELNERSEQQYEFAKELDYISEFYQNEYEIKRVLLKK